MPSEAQIQAVYNIAKERYVALGVDTEKALAALEKIAISLHCWQGDDVGGFENPGGELGGGIAAEKLPHNLDAVEPKLFGIGSESYVTGSMEFYTAYAVSRKILLTLDSGHFHPTETIADKISSLLIYLDQMLLHVSRGVRWDSDHVVTFNDDLQAIAQEIVRAEALERVHIGLDYFDASINRIAAWTIGARNTLRALLNALLEPHQMLNQFEA